MGIALNALSRRAQLVANGSWRRIQRRPRLFVLGVAAVLLITGYIWLWRKTVTSPYGRWYFNYVLSFHSALIRIAPKGDWGPIDNLPRWVPEIYNAPWMGEWEVPALSAPTYHSAHGRATRNATDLSSTAIVKLDIFSTVSEKARQKRKLIRELSPLTFIPEAYRHLVEVKFVMGHAYNGDWSVNEEMEALLEEEQKEHGDLVRLTLEHGENLREGKILDWIRAVGDGEDSGRPAWYIFKVDDDSLLNVPKLLDSLLKLDSRKPMYLGTGLGRWPSYHAHYTGMVTGFSWPLVKTLAAGINKMSRQEIQAWWDDDVLTGEIMYCLPSAPVCQGWNTTRPASSLPAYCNPRAPPPWGWESTPPSVDPRSGLVRHDFGLRMAERDVWFASGDIATHSWHYKFPDTYREWWKKKIQGPMWKPPRWIEPYADPTAGKGSFGRT